MIKCWEFRRLVAVVVAVSCISLFTAEGARAFEVLGVGTDALGLVVSDWVSGKPPPRPKPLALLGRKAAALRCPWGCCCPFGFGANPTGTGLFARYGFFRFGAVFEIPFVIYV